MTDECSPDPAESDEPPHSRIAGTPTPWVRFSLAGSLLRDSTGALPAVALLAVALAWTDRGGAVSTVDWSPGAALAVLLGLVVIIAPRAAPRLPTIHLVALGFLAAYTVWNYATIAWSADRAIAWDGANRTLLYLAVLVVVIRFPWRASTLLVTLGGVGVAMAGLALATLASASAAADLEPFFIGGRLSAPSGYPNANAALLLIVFWPAVAVAASRQVSTLIRGVATVAAAVLLEVALLCQSRGSLIAFPVTVLVFLCLARQRLRALLFLALPVLATSAAAGRLLHVYTARVNADAPHAALRAAFAAVLVSSLVAGIAATAIASADRRLTIGTSTKRVVGIAVTALVVAALAAGGVLAVQHDVGSAVAHGWRQFTHNSLPSAGTSHLGAGLGSNRYDFWRVAWHSFVQHPLEGVGSDNFAIQYLQRRSSFEEPLYPHSLELRVLSETGIVGALLLVVPLLLLLIPALQARRASDPLTATASAASITAVAYWAVHGSADWFWEFPPLTLIALVALGAASRLGEVPARPDPRPQHWARPAAVTAIAAAALASIFFPWLSARETNLAAEIWRSHPQKSLTMLRTARRLDPVSETPDLTAGTIYARRHDWLGMRSSFAAATRRTPEDWYAHFELAIALARLDRPRPAARELDIARRLDPREPAIELVAARLKAPRTIDPAAIDELFVQRAEALIR